MGIAPSRYLGQEPEQVTTYEYDETGRLVRSVTKTEPEWDAYNRSIVQALIDYRESLHSCGRPLSESLRRNGHKPPDYTIGKQECTACAKLEAFTRRQYKDSPVPAADVLQVYTIDEARAIKDAQQRGGD